MSLLARSTLGFRYTLHQRIGTGGYSEVWRAHDAVLDRPVAIKLLHTEHARHAETLARFRSEAQLAGRLSHLNVARVYDFCDSGPADPAYLVMELIDGPSLAEVLARGPIDPARTMDIIAQAASGLQAAHAAGLVHRDIKPANIMLTAAGTVKITDFGLSHTLAAAPITRTGMLVGTPGYLAPERAAGARATPASDLYALGVLGYECLAGTPPFAGAPVEVALAHRDRPLPPLPAATPAAVASFIAELTDKDPGARPASARVVARRASDLHDWLAPGLPGHDLGSWPASPAGESFAEPVFAPEGLMLAAPVSAVPDQPTLVTMALPGVSQRPPGLLSRHRMGAAIAVIAVAVAGLSAVAVALADGPGTAQPNAASARTPGTQAAGAAEVRWSALIGEPVRLAVLQLHRQGFRARVVRLQTSAQLPGRVVSVRTAGVQAPGGLVTLVVAVLTGDHGSGNHKHDHGGDGGNGQGGQSGQSG
jgi:eukaryotic-like serine/threonine-protein kinase